MKMNKGHILIALMLLLFVAACDKYEDGPSFSIAGPTFRITDKNWVMEQVLLNDTDMTQTWKTYYPDYCIVYSTNKKYSVVWDGGESSGTWKFKDRSTELWRTKDGETEPNVFKILRLASRELWLAWTDGTENYETHLKKD
ncbi:MAG: hypothetical protein KKD31_09410 [Bacteroidetes bacterium]|nr:hypothetical protein [Bacteroidota bacterium]